MRIHTIETGFFKLDGGAMFGVVPKSLWQRKHPADDNNMCTWSMRCLLIETGNRKILVDTGIGEKQDEKFRSHFYPHGEASLLGSLANKGFSPEEITDVLLTHLHFDHVGGAVKFDDKKNLIPTFPNATYWCSEEHYHWAYDPNPREKASFLKENFVPLKEQGKLNFLDGGAQFEWIPGIELRALYGHTHAMLMPIINIGDKQVYYCADLLPSSFHVGMPYVMAYDVQPLKTLEEKARLYSEIIDQKALLIFEHDPTTPSATLRQNDKGRMVLGEQLSVETFLAS